MTKSEQQLKDELIMELHEINLRIIKDKINVNTNIYSSLVIRRKQIIQILGW